jgi:hypothetical protein
VAYGRIVRERSWHDGLAVVRDAACRKFIRSQVSQGKMVGPKRMLMAP